MGSFKSKIPLSYKWDGLNEMDGLDRGLLYEHRPMVLILLKCPKPSWQTFRV